MDGIPYTDHSIVLLCSSTIYPMAESDLYSSLSFDYWVLNVHNNFWGILHFQTANNSYSPRKLQIQTQCPERSKAPFAVGRPDHCRQSVRSLPTISIFLVSKHMSIISEIQKLTIKKCVSMAKKGGEKSEKRVGTIHTYG